MKPTDSENELDPLFKKHRAELSFSMPPGLKSKILDELSLQTKEQKSFFQWIGFGSGALATGFALIMAFQFGKMSASGPGATDEIVSLHVRSLMAEHLFDVASTDQHTVKPWFEGKIDFGPNVKDFAKDGFPLIGGRLDYVEGRTAAALVYRSNQHIINVLEHPASNSENSEPRVKTVRGYQIFSWAKDGMSYWAVSDLNAAELQRFVALWN